MKCEPRFSLYSCYTLVLLPPLEHWRLVLANKAFLDMHMHHKDCCPWRKVQPLCVVPQALVHSFFQSQGIWKYLSNKDGNESVCCSKNVSPVFWGFFLPSFFIILTHNRSRLQPPSSLSLSPTSAPPLSQFHCSSVSLQKKKKKKGQASQGYQLNTA